MTTLSDVTLKIGSGATPRGGKSVYTTTGTAFVRSQNVLDFSLEVESMARIDGDAADSLRNVSVQHGDVLVNITGDSVARCSVWERHEEARVSQHVAIVRPDPEKVSSRYLQYWLVAPAQKTHLLTLSSAGGSRKALTKAMLEGFPFGPHDLNTQRAIAEVLGALDDKIAANRRVVELGHDLGTTICKSAEAKPRPLINVADIVMGTSPRGDQLNELGSGVPFFQGVRDFGSVFPSTRVYTSSPQRMATAGSILFSVRAPVGQTNLAVGDVCIGRGLAALHTQEQPATLYFSLKAYPEVWDIYSGGGTVFSSITGKELQQTLVPMPDAFMTSDVELKLSALLKRLVAAERENQVLASTRDELLPLLMSGRITVGAASSRVEEVV